MHRLKTRPQFQAVLAGGVVARSAHFALHRLVLAAQSVSSTLEPGSLPLVQGPQALFSVPGACDGQPWLGAMVPKRWARRAVTRNAIKRQAYAVGVAHAARLPHAAYVVRLRATFDRKQFKSASSEVLKAAVRAELEQIFRQAARKGAGA